MYQVEKENYEYTVERRLSEGQSSETSNIRTHIFFVLRSNNEKSAITSRNKVLCHFYQVLYFVCTVLHCNGNIILEKHLDFMHCVVSRFGYPNYRLSELSLVPIISDNRRCTVFYYEHGTVSSISMNLSLRETRMPVSAHINSNCDIVGSNCTTLTVANLSTVKIS